MKAVKLVAPSTLELRDTPLPEPGPDEARLRITAAGLCHSDLHVLDMGDAWPVFGGTVGHEGAGTVDALGDGVSTLNVGDAVVVDLIWACGDCRACVEGRSNACETGGRNAFPATPGLGPDGAMAEYMIVPARFLVPIGDLDPVSAAPLVDAGVTPMHAIASTAHRLTPGSTVVVIGIGGLGHLGVQIIKAISAARIIAVDTDESRLDSARRHGADLALLSNADAAPAILAETGGYGADVVIDFVGVAPTVDLAAGVIAPEGLIRLVGLGGGVLRLAAAGEGISIPWGVDIQRSYGGTRADLLHVIALAQSGHLTVDTVTYPLADFQRAFDDLRAGTVPGRAVLVP